MQVADKTIVLLRYCMKNSNGHVLDNRLNASPVEYLHGSGNITPALEKGLEGLRPGESKTITINSTIDTQLDAAFYFDVVIDDVRMATNEEIKKGKPAKNYIKDECGPGCVC
jgi:FKBP-type peptidyl-prolyl cis-trans isomerase 2